MKKKIVLTAHITSECELYIAKESDCMPFVATLETGAAAAAS